MSYRERHTAQFHFTAERELLVGGEKPQDVNMTILTREQLVAGIHEGHYEWFQQTEQLTDTSDVPESARLNLIMAEACLQEMGLRYPRGNGGR